MSKYNVGEMVKLRNDLEEGKYYGAIKFLTGMKELQNKPIQIKHIDPYDNTYVVGIDNWWISDEMIEGFWRENKPKLKMINVLDMIANGELKEGTKFVYRGDMYIWEDNMILNTTNYATFDIADRSDLNTELELIEPEHIFKDTKMIEDTQIPELDISELEIEGVDDLAFAFENMCDQLNKVIRKTNAQTTVLLSQEKEIKDIKEQLDY